MPPDSSSAPDPAGEELTDTERARLATLVKGVAWTYVLCRISAAVSLTAALVSVILLFAVPHMIDAWLPGLIPALGAEGAGGVAALGMALLLLAVPACGLVVLSNRLPSRLDVGGAVLKHDLRLILIFSIPGLGIGAAAMWLLLQLAAVPSALEFLGLTGVSVCAVALPSVVMWILAGLRDVLDVTLASPFEPGSPADSEWREIQARRLARKKGTGNF